MSIEAAGSALKRSAGGRGLLLGGVPGVVPARVVVIGGGVVGTHAARMAVGPRRGGHDPRPLDPEAARTRRAVRGPGANAVFDDRGDRTGSVRRRCRDRRRARSRRQRAEAGDAGDAEIDAAGRGAGRCRDRPGRLLRDVASDHARRTRPIRSTASSITAWRTCPARFPSPRARPSTTRRCRSAFRSRTMASPPWRKIRICGQV